MSTDVITMWLVLYTQVGVSQSSKTSVMRQTLYAVNNNTLGQRVNRVEDKEPACEQAYGQRHQQDADLCTCAFLADDTMYK